MGIFFKRKTEHSSWANVAREKLQWKVAFGLHHIQQGWAAFMHSRSERLSRKGKLLTLGVFMLLGTAYCCLLVCRGFTYKDTARPALPRIETTVPVSAVPAPSVEKREILRVLHFKRYLDSLAKSPNGNPYYRDLMRRRPGLMDSLRAFEMLHEAVKPKSER